ncbi:hypothetical protein EC957_006540 [Mortierella hygrophila]|uniref:Uncharacterized protein n=1 Tax=Mortierella hygrophila TaxID=979708 RepID=A0A9P6K8T7_9FUNG|nr:hypothetical protein EC957_006540 [Mortierella hygrophila]
MVRQRQYQQPTNGGAGSKAPLLILGAAALMIQGLLVLPIPANAETTITISSNNNSDNNNNNNNGASVIANSGNSKVSFDLGVHHNLQTIASLSTGGSGPAGAGPQLWGTTSAVGATAATVVSHSNNATTPVNLRQEQQQKDVLEGASLALYRKIRLEETSDAPAAVDATTPMAATAKDVGVVKEVEDIQSGKTEPAIDDGLENEVAPAGEEPVSRNTDANTTDTKKKDGNKNVAAVAVVDEESFSVILSPVSLSTLSTAANDDKKKKSKKTTVTELEDEKKADDYDDNEDVQNDKPTIATDEDESEAETETETETETKTEAVDGTTRVGDQVVLDKDSNPVKDVILEKEAEKKATDTYSAENHEDAAPAIVDTTADATTYNKESKPLKPEEEEEGEEEGEEKEDPSDKKDEKGKKGEEDNAEDDKDADETKDEATTMVPDGGKKKGHRKQAFARLREQLVKQQQQQLSTGETDTAEAPAESDQTADATTPMAEDTTTTLARAADFVPPEDMRAVMDAKAERDKTGNKKTQSILTPQQIADTEHQGANAFFELFAADVFPDVKLVGNNQLQDLDFEQRLNKQKEDKKAKAAKKKQQQDKKDKKEANKKDKKKVANKKDKNKVANKEGGMKQQQDRHQNEKRALPAAAPDMTEKERVHAALENIFGKDGAAKIEAEADDSSDVEITAQGLDKGIFATANAADAKYAKKNHHKKKKHHHKHHHKHHAMAATKNDVTSIFTTDAKDTKDNKLTPPADSPMSKPRASGPPEYTVPGSSAGQPQPQQHQTKQPASGTASPASPPGGAPPAGAKGGPAAPSKGETGTAGFGTVPMFGPAQLDLGNSAASLIASKSSIALAFVFGVAWMVL